ncbi:repeatdomain containing protein [Pyrenophora tritici-repentis]|nr:hypothetical protein PtrM4_148760 [Pyrenophora tritici-repentis]KAI1528184.1 repeatdomain containing protein [Pyrenophora tritici-repentis]KAI1552677.1 repeatdomain containing protein [Pyrenophora tritici-repentis]KAI1567306.1 repeatdomain containing protein [Pyrenophora tritici-repentis]KAI1580419.1 repeatdomain containing protein [Pyrenophora tritici-repentis]
MKGVTPPLLTDSPNPNRRPSEHAVPSALRIGTPTIGDTPPFDVRPPLKRKSTSGTSDRLSQLFPSRPSSVASIVPPTSTPASRRQSFPPPIDTNSDTSYRIPRAPPPPSFAEETSYNPVASVFAQPRASPLLDKKNSRTKRVLHRIASLHGGASRGGSYYRLDDEEWGTRRAGLKGVEEDDEAVGYDLSLLSGLDLKGFEAQSVTEDRDKSRERIRDMNEASHAAEFENFESQLGAGMTSILHKPFTHTPSGPVPGFFPGHRRILSASDVANAEAKKAQVEAEKTGQVVAVATEIPVDISDFTAVTRDFDSMSSLSAGLVKKDAETSYFFPKGATSDVIPYALSNIDADPQMPAWRPTTMSWWWISMLIVIALALAGVQEYLCQISLRSVEKDPIKGGLSNFQRVGQLPITLYFAWQYAPIMIFVFYGVLWQMSDFEVKRLEPFYQLSKKTGATAGESLNMDYLTFMSWLVPLRALRHKQFAVIYSSLGTLIASSLVPVLQSASITMWPPEDNRENDGWKSIRVRPAWSRALSSCLVIVACCGGALLYAMQRKSGLQSDSKGIAGIAAMATKSHILADFKGLDQAPLNKIHKQLRQRRYILHKSSLWQGEYISNSKEKIHEQDTDPRPLMLRLRVGVPFVGFLIAFTIIVPIVTFVEVAGAFTEELPWIMTGLATIIRITWNTMNADVRMLQPFYMLSLRHAPARTLTLDYAGTNPLWLPIEAFLNGHYLVMLVAFGSILAEILTVCVSSISVDGKKFIPGLGGQDWDDNHDGKMNDPTDRYNTEQTFRSFWTSFTLTMLILLYLIGIALLTYKKRSQKFLPRQIGTMASVLAFIHQSKMLLSFIDTEKFTSSEMTRHLEKSGKTYALGWFRGRDGDDHLGIDEEEITSAYVYGKDWTSGRLRPGRESMWEHY